jgi:hypothetical protein
MGCTGAKPWVADTSQAKQRNYVDSRTGIPPTGTCRAAPQTLQYGNRRAASEPRVAQQGAFMDRLTRYEWPREEWEHIECRVSESYRWAMTRPAFHVDVHPRAQLQPGEKKQTQEAEDQERVELLVTDPQRPSTGRTSKLGRKVEKPADVRAAGPSGQRDLARHDRLHANK